MRAILLSLVSLLALLGAPAAWAAPDHRAMALAAVDERIVPGYRRFLEQATAFEGHARDFCAAPDAAGLGRLRQGFNALMEAWQGVQHVAYGPVETFHRGQRVHFWPDKKNAGDRQMLALLKERKAEMLDPARVALASVAIQGLPAAEMLLFGEGQAERLLAMGEDGVFRCRVLSAIGLNLRTIGAELVTDWTRPDGFRAAIEDAGSSTSPYLDHRQAASHFFNAVHGQLQAVAEVKLGHPLGNGVDEARPGRAESWRSKRSLENMVINLAALRASFQAAFVPALAAEGRQDLSDRFLAALDRAMAAVPRDMAMEDGMTTPDGWKRLTALKGEIKAAARLLEAEVGPALGLQVGFNALDGD